MSEQIAVYRPRRLPLTGVVTAPSTKPRGGSSYYRRGSRAERELLQQLQQDGLLAIRSSGSHGPFDLVVVTAGGGRLLQVKKCGVTPSEATIVRWLGQMPDVPDGWSAELWYRTPRGWSSIAKQGRVP